MYVLLNYVFCKGDTATYSNWDGGHRNHISLNCAVLQPSKNGTWDDRDCDSGLFGLSHQDIYFAVCEFGELSGT